MLRRLVAPFGVGAGAVGWTNPAPALEPLPGPVRGGLIMAIGARVPLPQVRYGSRLRIGTTR